MTADDGTANADGPTLLVEYGDFAATVDRFAAGGGETFRDQRSSVAHIQTKATEWPVTVICHGATAYDRIVSPGLRVISLQGPAFHGPRSGRAMIETVRPRRVIAGTPHVDLIRSASRAGLPVFACLADLFVPVRPRALLRRKGIKDIRHNLGARRWLGDAAVTAVANHGRRATRSLSEVLGIRPERTLMREHIRIPMDDAPYADGDRRGLLFVGNLLQGKGIGDLVTALGRLGAQAPHLDVIGDGPMREPLAEIARDAGIADRVTFHGQLANDAARDRMRRARAVVVPSRHAYGEGMPNVILEALSTRTPLIVSDHPAFADEFADGGTALTFRASDPDALAGAIRRLAEDAALRARLASTAGAMADRLHVGHPTALLIDRFVADDRDRTGWVRALSLAGEGADWL